MTKCGLPFKINLLSAVLLITVLSGCATTRPDAGKTFNTDNTVESQFDPESLRGTGNKLTSLPKAPDTKPLPEMTPAELEQAGNLMFLRGDFSMAFVQYEKCLSLDPENTHVRYKKGLVLLAADLNQDALKVFEGILEKKPDYVLAYEGLGRAYFQMRQYEEAEKKFLKALETSPNLWRSRNLMGMIYDSQKRYDEAAWQYLAAIHLQPHMGLLHHNIGVSYYLAGRYQEAIDSFQTAIKNHYSKPKTYNTLALSYAKIGQYSLALDAFTKGGNKAKAYNNLGCFFMAQGEYKRAITCFEKALKLSPEFYATASENLKMARIAYHRHK